MKQNKAFMFFYILFLICLLPSGIFAADVVGTVTDNVTGLPISNVVVKILESGDSTMTDINGNYFIPSVVDGSYTLLVGTLNYTPLILTKTIGTCCIGVRGNVNNDISDAIDISDLVYLVAFMFQGGASPVCFEEADIDGSAAIDISDLVYIVAFMFQGGAQPASCL